MTHTGVHYLIVMTFVTTSTGNCLLAAEPPSMPLMLKEYERSINRLQPVHLQIVETGYVSDGTPQRERVAGVSKTEIYHKESQWKVRQENSATRRNKDKLQEYRGEEEYVVGEQLLRVHNTPRLRTPLKVSASLHPKLAAGAMIRFIAMGAFIFGVVDRNEIPLWQTFSKLDHTEISSESVKIDGFDTYFVKGQIETETYTFWLDPLAGYLPRQMEIRRTGEVQQRSRASDGRKRRGANLQERPPAKVRVARYENIHIENRSGRFIITAFDLRPISYYEAGPETNRRWEYRVEHVDFDPQSWPADTFSPTIEIPNGTPVAVEEEPTIYYAWNDGKIEKTIDPALLRQPALKFQAPARARTRLILLLVVNALLAAGALYWFIRSRRGKQSP